MQSLYLFIIFSPAVASLLFSGSSGGSLNQQQLGIGTWAWGDKLFWGYDSSQDASLKSVFEECMSLGISTFDTAEIYGFGRSELLLGRFNRLSSSQTKPVFATKFAPLPWRFQGKDVVNACRDSMDRLGVDSIDLYQIHFPGLINEPYWSGLADCYNQGLVKHIGVSNYGPNLLRSAHKYFADRGIPLESNQIQYSLLCRQQETNGALQVAQDLNITTLAYSPLAQGILTGKFSTSNLPTGPRSSLVRNILPRASGLLDVMKDIAESRNKTMSQVALNWAMAKGTVPIPGARSLQQAQDNAGALGWELEKEEVSQLDRSANQCGVNIPLALQSP